MDGTSGVYAENVLDGDRSLAMYSSADQAITGYSFVGNGLLSGGIDGADAVQSARTTSEPKLPVIDARRRVSLFVKRVIDIVGALTGLILLAPLLIVTAIGVKLTDRGPVFFRQARVGRDGKNFEIYKFRSMYWDRCDLSGIAQTVSNDQRITPIGAFIRKTSIDELPQLINVLIGDMSLVGPRPHVRGMMAAGMPYEQLVPHYDFRHAMRPGLTGWAQCNGLRGPTVDQGKAVSRIAHDFAYIQNFSVALDIRILFKTIASELLSSTAN